ncbi:MAG: DUF58 domain-containing protein [Myxococcota bacterium]
MLPIPRPGAVAAYVAAIALCAVGIGTRSSISVAFGGAILFGLALALMLTMPLGRRVRRQRLEFAWWLAHGDPGSGGGAVVPGAPFEVRCYIRHRGPTGLTLGGLSPVVPGGANVEDDRSTVLSLPPRARTEFSFRLRAPAVGRVVLHGLAVSLRGPFGLFAVPLYFPNPLAIKVLPRVASRVRSSFRAATGSAIERSGRTVLRRRGGGTELYELRELMPGDPFKSIAWKASARAGKLMVKEVEQEVQETRWIVLDVSGTMRGGEPGKRKLDFAIELAAAESRRGIDAGDRVGLITVDGRVLDYVPPRDDLAQMIRIYDALLAATEVVDQDLTDVDDDDVPAIVGRYIRNQDGVDFARRDGSWDVQNLVRHVQSSLIEEQKRSDVLASTSHARVLRRFCRARGIPLPYRPDPRDGAKGPGLAGAIRRTAGSHREPASVAVITDFDGIGDLEPLEAAVKLSRAHRHQLVFLAPEARRFVAPPNTSLSQALSTVYGRGEERRLREAKARLGRLGAPVLPVGPGLATHRARPRRIAA